MHRRLLPIIGPCEGFEPGPGATGEGGYCARCRKVVHDVSAMEESELRRFLGARAGTEICVSYRVGADGWVRLRPSPRWRPVYVAALAGLLAACAGHAEPLEHPGAICVDASGYEVACSDPAAIDMTSVPEGLVRKGPGPRSDQGCPVRPTAPGPGVGPEDTEVEGGLAAIGPETGPRPSDSSEADSSEAPGTHAKARVDFAVDPEAEVRLLGVMVVPEWIERDFVPTAQLWAEARERRARRRAWRRRLRSG